MTPTIADRIDSLIQAMADIVVPAIDPAQILAKEQAGLIMAHLGMIRAQLPFAERYVQVELDAAIALGRDLVELVSGGPQVQAAGDMLARALDEAASIGSADRQSALNGLNSALEHFVRASRIDGAPTVAARAAAKVLADAKTAAWHNRVWFNGSGFDAEQSSLPDRTAIWAEKTPEPILHSGRE